MFIMTVFVLYFYVTFFVRSVFQQICASSLYSDPMKSAAMCIKSLNGCIPAVELCFILRKRGMYRPRCFVIFALALSIHL